MEDTLKQNTAVALYARVSTEEQREGQTIDSQIAELERFAQERGWIVTGIFRDEGWSGSLLARPALDEMRDEARNGSFTVVVVNDVDRLARDVSHLGIIIRHFERHGVRTIFRKLPTETGPTRNLMINVLGSFAEFERELIADRTRRGRRHKVEVRKEFVGCLAPYGYRYIPGNGAGPGRLELEPAEALVVRRMFQWVDAEGLSARKVLERLDKLRIRPRKGGVSWGRSSVCRILRCETYAGVWHYFKHVASVPTTSRKDSKYRKSLKSSLRRRKRDEWMPIELPEALRLVERGRWQRVQEQLDRNRAFSPRNAKHNYLLRGLIRCGGCGARYVGEPSHGRFCYRCSRRCNRMPQIKEAQLNELVWQAVRSAVLDPRLLTERLPRLQQAEVVARRKATAEAEDSIRAAAQLDAEERRILEAYRLAVLSPIQLRDQLREIRERRDVLRIALPTPVGACDDNAIRSIFDYCNIMAGRLERFDTTERQRFLQHLLREIIFEGQRIRIRGVISVQPRQGTNSDGLALDDSGRGNVDVFAATESRGRGHRPADFSAVESTTSVIRGHNPADFSAVESTTSRSRGRNPADFSESEESTASLSPGRNATDFAEPEAAGLRSREPNSLTAGVPFELVQAVPPLPRSRAAGISKRGA